MIALEYAKALFELSQPEEAERVYNELGLLCDAFEENPDAIKVLKAPNISTKEKKKFISNISNDMCDVLKRFLLVLIDNDRYEYILKIKDKYHELLSNKIEIVDIDVISHEKLDNDQIKKITAALKKKYAGKEIVINNIVDNNLLGGYKIIANGKCIDLSIKGKFSNLKKQL